MSDVKELTVIERAAIALGADEGEKQLIALAKKYTDITDIKNPAGRTQCHAAAMELSNARIHVDKTGKAAREDANAFQKAVIAEVARRVAIIKPEEERLLALRDDWDEARAAEKAAIAAAEKARVDGIRARIEAFMLDAVTVSSGTAAEIDAHATSLSLTVIDLEGWQEFAGEAQVKRDDTVKWLRERQQDAASREAEALRLIEERAQLERDRAAVAEHARKEAAARAEQERKDREAREVEDALVDGIRKNARRIESNSVPYIRKAIGIFESMAKDWENDSRQRVSGAIASAREEMQEKLRSAEQAAEREAAEAELRKQREAEEARIAEQRAELARQQAAIDAANAERERVELEAARAAEARAWAEQQAREMEARVEAQRIADEQAAEARRVQAEKDAAEAERIRRERVDFLKNGPDEKEIILLVANHYGVSYQIACNWIGKIEFVDFTDDEEKAA